MNTLSTLRNLYTSYRTPFDNDTDVPKETTTPDQSATITLTEAEIQKRINDAISKQRDEETKKYEQENKQLLANIEMLQKKANITEEERKKLQKSKDELENRMLTQEQLDKKERERKENEYQQKLATLEKERNEFKTTLESQTIDRAILDATNAPEVNAYNPNIVHTILRPNTTLKEQLDKEGNPTGKIVPMVELPSVDETGRAITLTLTPTQAVEHLKGQKEYANLFIGKGVGGLGLSNGTTTSGSGDASYDAAMNGDMKAFFASRGIKLGK